MDDEIANAAPATSASTPAPIPVPPPPSPPPAPPAPARARAPATASSRWTSRYARWVAGAAGGLLLVVGALIVIALASPVRDAHLRLQALTDFVGFTAKGDGKLAFEVSAWTLRAPVLSGFADGAPIESMRRPAGTVATDRIELWLAAGDEVLIRRLTSAGDRQRFAVTLPLKRVPVTLEIAAGAMATWLPTDDGDARTVALPTNLRGELGELEQPSLVFEIGRDSDESRPRIALSGLGFGRPDDGGGAVQAGLISASLHFLDKPNAELRLGRGSDLRLSGVDVELASLQFSAQGIELHGAGSVTDARLQVGPPGAPDRQRSVVPTYYDRLQGEPLFLVASGFVAVVATALGLVLSLLQVSGSARRAPED